MKVNVGASGTARLIMRNKGNFRLLLNASIWPGMKVTPMEGGKVSLKSHFRHTTCVPPSNQGAWPEDTNGILPCVMTFCAIFPCSANSGKDPASRKKPIAGFPGGSNKGEGILPGVLPASRIGFQR